MVLAGGKGERLYPLTEHRAKPAVPFGGIYRLIDFVLSNLVNSGIFQIYFMTQYKAQHLLAHLQHGWAETNPMSGSFVLPVPAQMRIGEGWYLGTADAIYQNIYLIKQIEPDLILIFGADHVYLMDVSQMIRYHLEKGAEVTVCTMPYPITECRQFGVAVVDASGKVGVVENSIMGGGSIVSGGYVRDSIIGRNVYIDSGARVEETIIMGPTLVELGAKVLRAIIDHENVITSGEEIGYDQERDMSRYHVDESGIVVIRRGYYEQRT
ncbi:MAG: hypothetical protein JRF35_14195 [Deltaproteobacteria bacterium]|nr:hypothetical protein [Deltaproteobacteria bacterium]